MKSAEEEFGSKSADADAGSRDLDLMSLARSTPYFQSGGRYKKQLAKVEEILGEGEQPLGLLNGQAKNSVGRDTIGIAVTTNKRLIYVGDLVFQTAVEQFPLDKVDSVQESGGMALAGFMASVPGSTFVLAKAPKQAVKPFVEVLRNAIAEYQAVTAPPGSQLPEGPLDQLKKLAELHDAGVLSDDEFESKKAKLLDQIYGACVTGCERSVRVLVDALGCY